MVGDRRRRRRRRSTTVATDVRGGPVLLPVPGLADDRALPAQQRGADPAGRARVRRAPLDGLLPARRGIRHVPGRQVPHQLGAYGETTVLSRLHRDVGWVPGRLRPCRRRRGHRQRLLHHLPRRPWPGVRRPGRHHRDAVPALRDAPGAPLGARHRARRHHDEARRPVDPLPQRRGRAVRRCPRGRPLRQARLRPADGLHARSGAGDVREPDARDHDSRRRVRCHDAAAGQPGGARRHARRVLLRQRLHVGRARPLGEVRAVRAVVARTAAGALAGPRRPRDRHGSPGLLRRPAAHDAGRRRRRAAGRCSAAGRRVAAATVQAAHDRVRRVLRRHRESRNPVVAHGSAPRPRSTSTPSTPEAR